MVQNTDTVKPVQNRNLCKQTISKRPQLVFKTNYRLMLFKRIAECSERALWNTLTFIKLPFVIMIFVLSISEWPFYTAFTVSRSIDERFNNISLFFTRERQRIKLEKNKSETRGTQ